MKTLKKTKYEQVVEILEKEGYLNDSNRYKIWGDETGIWKANEHIRRYNKLKNDREFFSHRANNKILELKKGHRCYLIRFEDMTEGQYYKIGKDYFDENNLIK